MTGVVSKETVVLRRWGSGIQNFGFINGVDNVNWPPYRDSKRKSGRAKQLCSLVRFRFCSIRIRSDEGLITLETSAFRISVRWPIYIINSVDKTKLMSELSRNSSHARKSPSSPTSQEKPYYDVHDGVRLQWEEKIFFTNHPAHLLLSLQIGRIPHKTEECSIYCIGRPQTCTGQLRKCDRSNPES